MSQYFDYETAAREAGLSDSDLERLKAKTRTDYPQDDMLFELRLLRTCVAIRDSWCSLADALRPDDELRATA